MLKFLLALYPRPPPGILTADFNSVDVNKLKTYQQLYIYFIPILTNLGLINIIVVVVRLIWFWKHLEEVGQPIVELNDPVSVVMTFPSERSLALALLPRAKCASVGSTDRGWAMPDPWNASPLSPAPQVYPISRRVRTGQDLVAAPKSSSIQEPLSFLLNHPRRCYTLLFPSGTTWALCGILIVLNFIDTLLIIVLDWKNDAVATLAAGPRVAAAIFQAVSSRHTGMASFNLAEVNPAVQMSLLVMMYISVFPIALAIRSSNTYEEKGLSQHRSAVSSQYSASLSFTPCGRHRGLPYELDRAIVLPSEHIAENDTASKRE
ncbi:cation transport protein-domain-containing protein [Ilyonectria destructans]|nr:cation transport protein-domain-containing protein [Ilyonectria destructans]